MKDNLCYGCMTPREGGEALCLRCGFDRAAYREEPHQLAPGTLLRSPFGLSRGGLGNGKSTRIHCQREKSRR